MQTSHAGKQRTFNYINKITTLDNVRIHSLWDTVYSGQAKFTPTLHSHFNHEVQICIQGDFCIEPELGAAITMGENDVCIIPRETLHASCPGGVETQMLALRFYIEELTADVPFLGLHNLLCSRLDTQNSPIKVNSPQIAALMGQIHTKLYDFGENAGAELELLLIQFFSALFNVLITDTSTPTDGVSIGTDNWNTRAYKIETFFSTHCADQLAEKDLARYLNLSLRQTTREIQRLYGVTFREKLIQVRMRQAATLLLRTEMSINEIASAVGYISTSGFFSMFREYYGITPSAYRRKCKERM